MFGKLLFIFIGVPLVEVLILIKLGEVFGFWSTVALVLVTGFLGALLARIQGWRTWFFIQQELLAGRIPAAEMIDALIIFAAGLLLLTPGLLTDLLGFFFLIPATRGVFKRWIGRQFQRMAQRHQGGFFYLIR